MRIFRIAATGMGLLAASLMTSNIAFAGDIAGHIGTQILPTASFAPANVQLPQENPTRPALEPALELPVMETLDPLLVLESRPKKKQAKFAYKYAKKAIKVGDFKRSIVFLRFAAEKGYLLAQWRLANAFRNGLGVEKSDTKALDLFLKVADSHKDTYWESRKKLRATVSALVALADYSRTGVKGTSFTKNLQRSQRLYLYAASRYGHPGAQYQLGVMYLKGEGVDKNQLVGMKWLMLASRKGFVKAQAMLGDIYMSFKNSPKSKLTGLMWHGMVEKNAAAEKEEKILARSSEIFAQASESERALAVGMIAKLQGSNSDSPRQ